MGALDVLTRKSGVIVGDDVLDMTLAHEFLTRSRTYITSSTVVAALEAARGAHSSPARVYPTATKRSIYCTRYQNPAILDTHEPLRKEAPPLARRDCYPQRKHTSPPTGNHLLIGVDNTGVDNSALYCTQPEDIWEVYSITLAPGSLYYSIAVGLRECGGVYKPGHVRLHPELLGKHQESTKGKIRVEGEKGKKEEKPLFLVFYGGSGSTKAEFEAAIGHGVVKGNLYAYSTGIRDFIRKLSIPFLLYLPTHTRPANNPDPRVWAREGEKTMCARVKEALHDFNTANQL
ncbi:hypothetical protein B9Z19DRAFT_1098103 [Tuber borchii]|uniref:Fructose-bisphosphate aldolase n=1 Tax=Tuber borchii TaxID=42251 RepID=A0A2T7A993_TUBBO|nr:hypothetical protein B9Z19DRAFT_1098103 [Tuber borchii]